MLLFFLFSPYLPPGSAAVTPVNPKVQVALSRNVNRIAVLEVEVAGDPPIKSEDILWSRVNMQEAALTTNPNRIFLANLNKSLIIGEYDLSDNGIYRIDIRRRISKHQYDIVASAFIEFLIVCKYLYIHTLIIKCSVTVAVSLCLPRIPWGTFSP